MPTQIEKLAEGFRNNTSAFPDMLGVLAEHLGVTANALHRLGVGWCPIAEFKKGKNFLGWWAIPERNSGAKTVGISLRSMNDLKVMYPGSDHGLFYEVNPEHEHGNRQYEAGAHNWVRTMETGIACPICGKPDGCLLSSENPSDPKAVVCIRERSPRELRFGFLHIRKSDGLLTGRRALADDGRPLVIVEGASDAATALDLGFAAVGRASNRFVTGLADLVRGYSGPIWIIGENDKKANGDEPGKEGMTIAFQAVRGAAKSVTMVMPPPHIKDLRVWKLNHGLTDQQLDAYVTANGFAHVENATIEDDRPHTVALTYLNEKHKMGDRFLLRRWESEWYQWRDSHYRVLSEDEFHKPLWLWAKHKYLTTTAKNGNTNILPLHMTKSLAANLSEAMSAETLIEEKRIPAWLNGIEGPESADLVIFSNGILNVSRYLRGEDNCMVDPTPDLFTTSALPFAFDPIAKCPEWHRFLKSSLGDDPKKIDLVREWIGYCMTSDTCMQKMMFMRGPPSSGKGTLIRVITELVGKDQTAAATFSDLSGPFGLQSLVGKNLCTVGDSRTPKNGDVMRGLEVLLNIVGNDNVPVNRKNLSALPLIRMSCRIVIASNSFLEVPDESGAMMRRLLFLEFKHSFLGKEDKGLEAKLAAEIPGIAVWALEGLRQLKTRGYFTTPDSSKDSMIEWRLSTSPLAAFLEECCEIGKESDEVQKSELFDAWDGWSRERAMRATTRTSFFNRMRNADPRIISDTYEKGAHKFSVYRGIRLKEWAARKFTGAMPT